jgi:hypothetical protein
VLSKPPFTKENTTMIKRNDTTNAASINVLAEGELDQVVGGYCHGGGKRWGGGGWGHGRCHKRGYEGSGRGNREQSYDEPRDEGYSTEGSGDSVEVNNQVIELEITINQVAV